MLDWGQKSPPLFSEINLLLPATKHVLASQKKVLLENGASTYFLRGILFYSFVTEIIFVQGSKNIYAITFLGP
jgi:hypothetical protein